ncbi:hypothetical protein OG497_37460 [Streptomyces sp. NBC_01242]|uniref:hypothetical protein n=1 Tax=Streptomyces sp. NBC_01242 TaxID=2903795 RepID=UPI00225A3973|nr:hypothetical protein [Streptomyces sp. NBC_01242]MCX4799547.1 hypothetical protein [Streptomyces sp. NBC_01242]
MIRSAATYGLAWSLKQVTLREVDRAKKLALGVDTEGQYVEVRLSIRRSDIVPKVGQIWLIDRDFGEWSLNALVDTAPPDLTGGEWAPLKLLNNWVPSGSADDPAPSARVTKNGWVELSGVMYSGSVPALGQVLGIGSLPEGFPAVYRGNAVLASQLPNPAGYVRGGLTSDGVVTIQVSAAYTPAWIDLTSLRSRIKG